MKTLKKVLSEIGFYEREKIGGKHVAMKCGRDFLYYALNYYFPDQFNATNGKPSDIDAKRYFGYPVSEYLAWTQIQFVNLPGFLREHGLELSINDRRIDTFAAFVGAILFSRKSYEEAFSEIESLIDSDTVCGIDISLGSGGLLDHIIFVYGYDDENLYVIDTHQVPRLEYQRMNTENFFMRLPKQVIRARWTKFGRVWKVDKSA